MTEPGEAADAIPGRKHDEGSQMMTSDVEKRPAASTLAGSPELHGWKFDTPVTGAAFAGHGFSPGMVGAERSNRVHHAMHEDVEHFRLSDSSDEHM